jgi:hypothetical protein
MIGQISSNIFLHDEEIQSIFELLGSDENDLSFSIGFTLSKSPKLLKELIKRIFGHVQFKNAVIKLQQHGKHPGFTDMEIILDNKFFFVIEAKKGWNLPSISQFRRYLQRFKEYGRMNRLFVVLSDCTEEYFKTQFPNTLYNINISSISWTEIIELIDDARYNASNKEKWILDHLKDYLREVVVVENQESNWVYVVSLSLSERIPSWSKLSWRDMVVKKEHYFYPNEKNWPKIPPNYIAFRYDGKLQSIHHVKKYEVVQDVHKYIPEIKRWKLQNYYLLWLGPKFEPRKELPNGNIWSNGRFWCLLDTLFTSKTIAEAIEISKKRVGDD